MSVLCLYWFYIVWFWFIAWVRAHCTPKEAKTNLGKQRTDSGYTACNVIVLETDVKCMELKCLHLHLLYSSGWSPASNDIIRLNGCFSVDIRSHIWPSRGLLRLLLGWEGCYYHRSTKLIPACMYEGEVTTGVPAEAIVSPTSTTAHGPKTSEVAH